MYQCGEGACRWCLNHTPNGWSLCAYRCGEGACRWCLNHTPNRWSLYAYRCGESRMQMCEVVVTGPESKDSLLHHCRLDIVVLQNHILFQSFDGVIFLSLDLLGQQDLQMGQRSECSEGVQTRIKGLRSK